MQITSDGGIMYSAFCPDLGPAEIALVYEGDVDHQGLGASLDKLLIRRFER